MAVWQWLQILTSHPDFLQAVWTTGIQRIQLWYRRTPTSSSPSCISGCSPSKLGSVRSASQSWLPFQQSQLTVPLSRLSQTGAFVPHKSWRTCHFCSRAGKQKWRSSPHKGAAGAPAHLKAHATFGFEHRETGRGAERPPPWTEPPRLTGQCVIWRTTHLNYPLIIHYVPF